MPNNSLESEIIASLKKKLKLDLIDYLITQSEEFIYVHWDLLLNTEDKKEMVVWITSRLSQFKEKIKSS